MLMDYEEKKYPHGFLETKEIHKIQGFQDLTNRLQASLNNRYETSLASLLQQVDTLVKQNEAQQHQIDFLLSTMGDINKDVLVTLEQRIDVADQMIGHLTARGTEQEQRLNEVEMDAKKKMEEVEVSSAALQEGHNELRRHVEIMETDQDRQNNNVAGLEVTVGKLKNDNAVFKGHVEEMLASLHEADRRTEETFNGRLEAVDTDLAQMLRQGDLSQVLAELDSCKQDVDGTKNGLGDIVNKIEVLERNMLKDRKNIGIHKELIDNGLASINHRVDGTEEKVEQNMQELWRDQRQQDEELSTLKEDVSATINNLSLLSVDVKGFQDNVEAKIASLKEEDERGLKSLDKGTPIEEQNQLQVEQARYVETVNTKVLEVEKRQAAPMVEAGITKSQDSISVLQDDMRKLLTKLGDHEGELAVLRRDISGYEYLKDESRNIWESQRRQDHDIGQLEEKVKKIDIKEAQLAEIQGSLQELFSLQGNTEKPTEKQQSHEKNINEIMTKIRRLDSIDSELNSITISIRELLMHKINTEVLMEQQRTAEEDLRDLSADVRKHMAEGIRNQEESEEKRKRLDVDLMEVRDVLEAIEKRVSDNRMDIKELLGHNFQKDMEVFIESFKEGDLKQLQDMVEDKLDEVEKQSFINEGHVERLRELNNKLMVEVPSQVSKELQDFRDEIGNLDDRRTPDIDAVQESVKSIKEEFGQLKLSMGRLSADVRSAEEMQKSAFAAETTRTVAVAAAVAAAADNNDDDDDDDDDDNSFVDSRIEDLRRSLGALEDGMEDLRRAAERNSSGLEQLGSRFDQESADRAQVGAETEDRLEDARSTLTRGITSLSKSYQTA